ncbi:MAG: hypothetical protein ACRC8Q_07435 [Aeromonas sp.]
MQKNFDEQRNAIGLTLAEQALVNAEGLALLRMQLGKSRSNLDADWLALSQAKRVAICAIAGQPRGQLLTAALTSLPYGQREAIRQAVLELEYQGEFRCGCNSREWHQASAAAGSEAELAKRARADRLASRLDAIKQQQGPRAIGQ